MSGRPSSGEWLTRMLLTQGFIDEAGLGRRARLRTCPGCRKSTLAGLDAKVCALTAWTDLDELSALGEAHALIDGRRTYAAWTAGDRIELERRTHWAIRAHPAGHPTTPPVLATHQCGSPIPPEWGIQPRWREKTPDPLPDYPHDIPPF